MDDKSVSLQCYTGGKILLGPEGIYYNQPSTKELIIPKHTNYDSLMDHLRISLFVDLHPFSRFDVVYRYPIIFPNTPCHFEPIYIQGDDDLQFVLNFGFSLPPPRTWHFYVEKKSYSTYYRKQTPYGRLGSSISNCPPLSLSIWDFFNDFEDIPASNEFIDPKLLEIDFESDESLEEDGVRVRRRRNSRRRSRLGPIGKALNGIRSKKRFDAIPLVSQTKLSIQEGYAGLGEVDEEGCVNISM